MQLFILSDISTRCHLSGEIHTNYAAHKKIATWNLGRNLYDNNLRYVIRP